ncbi:hypothetical protein [Nocardia puris]|uniref:hypothetical protein n=1 Tax=Nocardia puris TaxID=208602 RepID=UPI001E3F032A|nr:hypothetical protein [Nocardia puris]
MTAALARARAVADAVLYEGYLLYPYRADSRKNRSRWQFGVLGPVGAAEAGVGEEPSLEGQCVARAQAGATLTLTVRFLQLQRRAVERGGEPVPELVIGETTWISWDETVERELVFGPVPIADAAFPVVAEPGRDVEELPGDARIVRTRSEVTGELTLTVHSEGSYQRVAVSLRNTGILPEPTDKSTAAARSLLGAHVIAEIHDGAFMSLLDPEPAAAEAVTHCTQHRCFPVLAGPPGDHGVVLVSPIILYDHPEIAEQSKGPLFDSTEIDEILTLRVMTLTEDEKARARATDPLAAAVIDRCDSMTPEEMRALHGVLRDPERRVAATVPVAPGGAATDGLPPGDPPDFVGEHFDIAAFGPDSEGVVPPESGLVEGETPSRAEESAPVRLVPEVPPDVDWWDPEADGAVRPESDAVTVGGVAVRRGSRVRLHPSRRADAHDLFYDGRVATVASVHADVDGETHVGVVIEDDPAADLHAWYGRYLYFAPDELEPIVNGDK